MPQLKTLSPNFIVKDVDKIIKFYEDDLGFVRINNMPEAPPFVWAMLNRNEVNLMFQQDTNILEELPTCNIAGDQINATMFIGMSGIKEYYESVKDKVEVMAELHEKFYGSTEFAIKDPEGNVLVFAEFPDR